MEKINTEQSSEKITRMVFTLNEFPVAKARHRSKIQHTRSYSIVSNPYVQNRIVTYDPQSDIKNETKLKLLTQMRERGFKIELVRPLHMILIIYTPMPKSWSTKRRVEFQGKYCTSRPDLDNYIKFYCDVLNEIAYHDDSQIVSIDAQKVYGFMPKVEYILRQRVFMKEIEDFQNLVSHLIWNKIAVVLTINGKFVGIASKNKKNIYREGDRIQEEMVNVMKVQEHRKGMWRWEISYHLKTKGTKVAIK